ncbi:MAG: tetratricopeptide repeat protein [Candidatus Obscuribacterales bacterium]|nr:tetratricopeptide repeat protein [Candidatus Obscuribacterales bacterium]
MRVSDVFPELEQAERAFESKHYADVISICSRLLEQDNRNAQALYMRACAFLESGRKAEAFSDYVKAKQLDPFVVIKRAGVYERKGLNAAAVDEYTRGLKFDPPNMAYLMNRLTCYEFMGHHTDALKEIDKIIGLYPKNYLGYYVRGNLLLKDQKYEEALASYARTIKLLPLKNASFAYKARIKILLKLRRYKEVVDDYTKILESNPKDTDAYLGRAIAYGELGQYRNQLADCDKALSLDKKSISSYANKASAYLNLAAYKAAVDTCKTGLEIDATSVPLYAHLAKSYGKLERYSDAIEALTKAISFDKGDENTWLLFNNRGRMNYLLKNYSEALSDYDKALALSPQNVQILINRAVLYDDINAHQKALNDLNELTKQQEAKKNAGFSVYSLPFLPIWRETKTNESLV